MFWKTAFQASHLDLNDSETKPNRFVPSKLRNTTEELVL
jgi:hypothetical protein